MIVEMPVPPIIIIIVSVITWMMIDRRNYVGASHDQLCTVDMCQ